MFVRLCSKTPILALALWWGVFLSGFASVAWPQGGIPSEQLDKLKAATVLVSVNTPQEQSSGSGFLIAKDAEYGYIATNQHVLDTQGQGRRRVQVVFNSGIPGAEKVMSATVAAEDPFRDLAVLRVRSTSLPEALKLASSQPIRETMQVWVFGFPFGEMLSTSQLHPSITVTTGTVTSLRLNDFGKISRVQVDADINEGNSGGPIVDATGGLVGIATEKVEGTKIGLGLPQSELEALLRGRVKESGLHLLSNGNGKATYRAVALLIDPLQKVRSASVFFVPQSQIESPKPNAEGRFGPMAPLLLEQPLTLKSGEYSGVISLENPQLTDTTFLQQIRLELADGQFQWSEPVAVRVPFSEGITQPEPAAKSNPGTNDQRQKTPPATSNNYWLGTPETPQPGAKPDGNKPGGNKNVNGPTPVASGRLLLGEIETEAGATFRTVNVSGSVTPSMLWSNDGKLLYLLEADGVLRKVSLPQFREETILQMEQKTDSMVLTRSGLAISLPALQEVWLIEPRTLQVLQRTPVGNLLRLTGSPLLDHAYAVIGDDIMSVIDLKAGQVTTQLRAKAIRPPLAEPQDDLGDFHFATVTPNGQYLMSGSDNLNRLRIQGTTLIYEEAGPQIGQNAQRIEISADSLYVALPSGGGNAGSVGPYATHVYKITDLKKPVLIIESGAYPRALAFDPKAGFVYAHKRGTPLMVFDARGIKLKSFRLSFKTGEDTNQLLPHPQGGKLLVLTGGRPVWVELTPPTP